MKKAFLLLAVLLSTVSVFAQNAEQTAIALNRTEVMEWENIQLKGEKINTQIANLKAAMKKLESQLADLNKRVLDSRKLDAKEYVPSWQANPPVVAKVQPKEAPKK